MVRRFETNKASKPRKYLTWLGLGKIQGRVKKKMKVSGKQVASARELLGITQGELASAAGVGLQTVVGFETGRTEPYPVNLAKILAELDRRGIEFTNGTGIGIRLDFEKAAEYARAVARDQNQSDR